LANRLLKSSEKRKKNQEETDTAMVDDDVINPLNDYRFGELFTNPDFEVDENTTEYKLLYPTVCILVRGI